MKGDEGVRYYRELSEELYNMNAKLTAENKMLKQCLDTATKLWQEAEERRKDEERQEQKEAT